VVNFFVFKIIQLARLNWDRAFHASDRFHGKLNKPLFL
jgi:hypothetical protein